MAYLLYGITEDLPHPALPDMSGVAGERVFNVSGHGLNAIVTAYATGTSVDIAGLMAYRDVIGTIHSICAVVPIRYGCVFKEQAELLCLLRDHREHYLAVLKRLDGLVEMGIRVLGDDAEATSQDTEPLINCRDEGRAFLFERKGYYEKRDKATVTQQAFISLCQDSFSGLYKECREEHHPQFLSLYFLVPKASVEDFQTAFHRMKTGVIGKLLLSGPWAPYNFVAGR